MKNRQDKRSIRLFYCLILAPAVLWGILSFFGVTGRLDYDTGEKRNKHRIEEGTTLGNLTSELELYLNDRMPFRSIMLSANSRLNWLVELPYSKGIQPGLIAWANASMKNEAEETDKTAKTQTASVKEQPSDTEENSTGTPEQTAKNPEETVTLPSETQLPAETAEEETEESTPQDYYPYIELAGNVIQGRENYIFLKDELADYQGSNIPSEAELAEITANMQTLKSICESKGQELYFVVVPNKTTVYSEYMPTISRTDCSSVQMLENYVHENSDVRFEFIDQEIIDAKQYGKLYYYNDTHWNGRGAMAAVKAIHEILGLDEIDMGSMDVEDGGPFIGDLIDYTGLPAENFAAENSVVYYYKMDIQANMIRGLEDSIDEYYSDSPDQRTLVMVGDSYRHHLMPYLQKDFAHTYFINNDVLSPECLDILNSADIILVEDVERTYFSHERARKAISDLITIMG